MHLDPTFDNDSTGKSTGYDQLNYLQRILNARVYDVAVRTDLQKAEAMSVRLRNTILFKREDTQPVFSFKLRGAYNKMAQLSETERAGGIIAASAGNHAQGVAYSAARLQIQATIVVPRTAPEVKVRAVRSFGGSTVDVIQAGESFSEAYAHAVELGKTRGLTFVHPFDDPDVIAGQGTVAMEILLQHQGPLHAIFVPIGGGSLAAGVCTYVKAVRPEVKVIGVQTTDSCAMARSIQAGTRVELSQVGMFSDGTAVKQVGAENFRLCRKYLDEVMTVTVEDLCSAMRDVFQDTRCIPEPAGALSVAGASIYATREHILEKTLVAITSGANLNIGRIRFMAEKIEEGAPQLVW